MYYSHQKKKNHLASLLPSTAQRAITFNYSDQLNFLFYISFGVSPLSISNGSVAATFGIVSTKLSACGIFGTGTSPTLIVVTGFVVCELLVDDEPPVEDDDPPDECDEPLPEDVLLCDELLCDALLCDECPPEDEL